MYRGTKREPVPASSVSVQPLLLSYARVSTGRQGGDEKCSLPDQLRRNRAIAEMRGIDRFDVIEYVDEGISGGQAFTKRPQGSRLWEEMKPGDIVVAAKLDRMFRSASDALTMLERFREREVKVILLDLGSDPIGETAISEAIFGLLAVFANLERKMIRERTDNGRAGKRLKGGFLGAGVPYGWKVEGDGKNAMLVPHPEEQKVVAIVCDGYERSKPLAQLIVELSQAGYQTRDGRPFWKMQIKRIHDYEMKRRQWGVAA